MNRIEHDLNRLSRTISPLFCGLCSLFVFGCMNNTSDAPIEAPTGSSTLASENGDHLADVSKRNAEPPLNIATGKQSDESLEIKTVPAQESGVVVAAASDPHIVEASTSKMSPEEEFKELLQKANDGDAESQVAIGDSYYFQKTADLEKKKENTTEAKKWYLVAVAQGNRLAMCRLGAIIQFDKHREPDYAAAVEWYRMALSKGSTIETVEAELNLGLLYDEGLGVPQNYVTAMEHYKRAAAFQNPAAMQNIGVQYEEGLGVPQDYDQARKWYLLAAEKGNASAQMNLSEFYRDGLGVEKNEEKELEFLKLAVQNGNTRGQFALGVRLLHGEGVEKDCEESLRLLNLALDKKFFLAQRFMGIKYIEGCPDLMIAPNAEEGKRLLKLAGLQGDSRSRYEFASACFDTHNAPDFPILEAFPEGFDSVEKIESDAALALDWLVLRAKEDSSDEKNLLMLARFLQFRVGIDALLVPNPAETSLQREAAVAPFTFIDCYKSTADAGLATSQLALGRCYLAGMGVAKDEAEGARWLESAARQEVKGVSDIAYLELGYCYYTGRGVEKDEEKANRCFDSAASLDQSVSDWLDTLKSIANQKAKCERNLGIATQELRRMLYGSSDAFVDVNGRIKFSTIQFEDVGNAKAKWALKLDFNDKYVAHFDRYLLLCQAQELKVWTEIAELRKDLNVD